MGAGPSKAKDDDSGHAAQRKSAPITTKSVSLESSSANATRAIEALQELQNTLHTLSPAEQWEVKKALPFATTEWQEGLSLSLRPVKTAFGESVHGQQFFANAQQISESALQKRIRLTPDSQKVVLVLVGLPARGKSMYGYKLEQFLSWRGYNTKSFKVGAWRRGEKESPGASIAQPSPAKPPGKARGLAGLAAHADAAGQSEMAKKRNISPDNSAERAQHSAASFFDSTKAYAAATREQVTIDCFQELLQWLETERGEVAIFDAANVTIARRAKLTELVNRHVRKHPNSPSISLVFIESICTDTEVVQRNMAIKCRMSPDFKGMALETAMADLSERISHYEKNYQTVREAEGAYIKIFDLRAKVHVANVYGRMAKSVLPYLMAVHALDRPVFLLRVDEPDAPSARGGRAADAPALMGDDQQLPNALTQWIRSYSRAHELLVLTSTQPRALAHAQAIAGAAGAASPMSRSMLAPLQRVDDPASESPNCSFRRAFGERVADLVMRLEPLALEIEGATAPVLVVAGEASIRTLRAFLVPEAARKTMGLREMVDGTVSINSHNLLEFSPQFEGGPMCEKVHALDAL